MQYTIYCNHTMSRQVFSPFWKKLAPISLLVLYFGANPMPTTSILFFIADCVFRKNKLGLPPSSWLNMFLTFH